MDITRFYVYIDGTLIEDEPIGIGDFIPVIERDQENRFIGVKYPLDLTFVGDGYDLIKTNLKTYGRIKALDFEIKRNEIGFEQGLKTLITGSILLTEGVDDVYRKEWKTKIRDNSYSRYIYSYFETGISLISKKSIDGSAITPITSFDLKIVDVDSGTTQYLQDDIKVKSFDFMYVINQMINYLSNGNLTVSSSWYDTLGYGIAVTPKEYITFRQADPIMSFKDVFLTVARLYNLWMGVTGTELKIEHESYFNSLESVLTIEDVTDIQVSYKSNYIYSKIKTGYIDPNDLLDDTQENGLSKHYYSNTYFKKFNLKNIDDASMNSVLDLSPILEIDAGLLIDSVKQVINGASHHAEHRTLPLPAYSEAVYDFDSINIDATSFNVEPKNHFLTTYNTSTNTQNNTSYVVDTVTRYRINDEFSNENVLSRYNLYSNYGKEKQTDDSLTFYYSQNKASFGSTDSVTVSGVQSWVDLITESNISGVDVNDYVIRGSKSVTLEMVGKPVTVRIGVMFPRVLQSGDDLDVYDSSRFFAYNGGGQIGDDFVEVGVDVSYLDLKLSFAFNGTRYEQLYEDVLSGVPYFYEYTFTPTTTGTISFETRAEDGVNDLITSPRYLLTVLGCSIQAENSNRIYKAKSADAYAVINSFKYPLSDTEIDAILANPFASITIDGKTAYHNSTKINLLNGTADFEVLTTKDTFEDEHLV